MINFRKALYIGALYTFASIIMLAEAIKPMRWGDEIIGIRVAEGHTYMQLLFDWQGVKLPPYYIFLKAWEGLTPWGYVAARLVSFVAILLTVAVTYKIAQQYGTERFALASMTVTAFSAALLDMGAWLRPYAIIVVLFAIGWYALLLVRSGNQRAWFVYVIVTALMVVTHHFGIIAVVAQSPLLYSLRKRMNPYAVVGIVAPTVAVGVISILALSNGGAPINHLEGAPTAAHLAYFLPSLLSGAVTDRFLTVGAAGLIIAMCWIVATAPVDNRLLELGSMIVVPTLSIVAFSYAIQPIFQLKYLSFLIPVAALFTVRVAFSGSLWQRRALLSFLLFIQAVGISELLRGAPRANWIFSLW